MLTAVELDFLRDVQRAERESPLGFTVFDMDPSGKLLPTLVAMRLHGYVTHEKHTGARLTTKGRKAVDSNPLPLRELMKPIVKVIAHTQFLGVPSDLLPMSPEADPDPSKLGEWNGHYATALGEARGRGQDKGTDAERLVECAGRTCYDSYAKGRASPDYHKHIMDVDHGSVTEHVSLTFFLSNISRGLTHELVRHRVGVAISQRSTRYVDENVSAWVFHPLMHEFFANEVPERAPNGELVSLTMDRLSCHVRDTAQQGYKKIVEKLEAYLTTKGIDKFTARKQARGAARGLLGNALMTEMVWTCNLRSFKTIMKQRANQHADAEIRVLANRLYEEALPYWPTYLGCYQKRPCPDGIGYELFIPDPKDAEIAKLKKQLENVQTGRAINEGT